MQNVCCFEPTEEFCHRHQVGEEIVQEYLSKLWGGEIGAYSPQLTLMQRGKTNWLALGVSSLWGRGN
ncbi:hypothetical protein A6770_37345 [Nostoc minutum NIES-26]|uniref:Uncharacterized protein n=1 Tax=Nostoc minutum NIES-26 TaxID=1844469 RepID=A0A367RW26_9NOSO|nr:hypothetical protein A6770_37345 [Nostoc minutum NIES-26]